MTATLPNDEPLISRLAFPTGQRVPVRIQATTAFISTRWLQTLP